MAEAAVEAFDIGVVGRLAGFDGMQVDVVFLAPGNGFGREQFGAVVDPDLVWQGTAFLELFEHADDREYFVTPSTETAAVTE